MPELQKKKRKAMSIQDTANGNTGRIDVPRGMPQAKGALHHAKKPKTSYVNTIDGYGYSGSSASGGQSPTKNPKPIGGYKAPAAARGIMDYAWIVYCLVMAVCLSVSLVVYNKNVGSKPGYSYPVNLISVNGIVNTIFDDYHNGGLGSSYTASNVSNMEGLEGGEGDAISGSGNALNAGTDGSASSSLTPDAGEVTNPISNNLPNSTTGATMALDEGEGYGDYPNATVYSDVVSQIDFALSSGDSGFVGRKLAYEDESGNLIGYPQSVVEHFTQYMASNEAKRQAFIQEIGGDSYAAKNKDAILVRLPLLKFTVNMGYDNTTLSISGFSDQVLNANQSAVVQPLLPCMYTVSVATNGGSQSSEIEANMKEGNLQINIGVTNQ